MSTPTEDAITEIGAAAPLAAAPRESSVLRISLRTATILLAFTVVFTALMAATYRATQPYLLASAQQEKLRSIGEVLPPGDYDNDLMADAVVLPPQAALGLEGDSQIWRARRQGQPVAVVFEAVAPNGYSGAIRLILAASADGKLLALRVTQHRETPGLGDYIDPRKDRNKARPWITQFNRLGFDEVSQAQWKVKKDGGHFDQMSGATISARAVTQASGKALAWARQHRAALFEQPAKTRLEIKE